MIYCYIWTSLTTDMIEKKAKIKKKKISSISHAPHSLWIITANINWACIMMPEIILFYMY